MKKKLTTVLAIVLVVALSVAGTYAYLTDQTAAIKNTFTVGNVGIDLKETTGNSYKMVPGNTISKDPQVTVKANSEDSYVFVKVEKSSNFDDFMTYAIADGWLPLTGVDGVYYREYGSIATDTIYAVLKDNKVTVKSSVTKAMMDNLTVATYPTLTFTAYACQSAGFDTAAAAWAELTK